MGGRNRRRQRPQHRSRGFDMLLSAYHITVMSRRGTEVDVTAPIGEMVKAGVWEIHPMAPPALKHTPLKYTPATPAEPLRKEAQQFMSRRTR